MCLILPPNLLGLWITVIQLIFVELLVCSQAHLSYTFPAIILQKCSLFHSLVHPCPHNAMLHSMFSLVSIHLSSWLFHLFFTSWFASSCMIHSLTLSIACLALFWISSKFSAKKKKMPFHFRTSFLPSLVLWFLHIYLCFLHALFLWLIPHLASALWASVFIFTCLCSRSAIRSFQGQFPFIISFSLNRINIYVLFLHCGVFCCLTVNIRY